jgi:hypothetical protein
MNLKEHASKRIKLRQKITLPRTRMNQKEPDLAASE